MLRNRLGAKPCLAFDRPGPKARGPDRSRAPSTLTQSSRLDGEAIAERRPKIVAVDELQPAAALGAVALDPEAESVELVPIVLGVHPCGEDLRAGGLDEGELARLAELAVDEFHRSGLDLLVVLGGHLARFVQHAAQIASSGGGWPQAAEADARAITSHIHVRVISSLLVMRGIATAPMLTFEEGNFKDSLMGIGRIAMCALSPAFRRSATLISA